MSRLHATGEIADRCVSRSWLGPAPRLSVVVATHDRAGLLPEFFDCLRAQRYDDFELIVVDDASTDATWPALRDACADPSLRLVVLRLAARRGPGTARNTGAAEARGSWLAFTDDDCLPTAGWLQALDAATEPGISVLQGRVEPVPGGWAGPWGRTLHVDGLTGRFETANLATPMVAFSDAGGFAPSRPVLGKSVGEDLVLGSRLARAGRAAFVPDALVRHRVMPGSYLDHLRERARLVAFPRLARHAPELRGGFPGRVFLSRRTLTVDAGIAGLAAAATSRRPLLATAALPWALECWRSAGGRPGRPRAVRAVQWAVGDVVGAAALAVGSARSRSVVL